MGICKGETNKSLYKIDENLANLEFEYDTLKTELLLIEDNPDHPNYRLILNKMWSVYDKINLILRG